MPFKNDKQQRACYATKGFGGKVSCKSWSDITNQKTLPKVAKKSTPKKTAKKKSK